MKMLPTTETFDVERNSDTWPPSHHGFVMSGHIGYVGAADAS